jgi:hypothetical protein
MTIRTYCAASSRSSPAARGNLCSSRDSAMGSFACSIVMSAVTPKADISLPRCNVRFVPIADILPDGLVIALLGGFSGLGGGLPSKTRINTITRMRQALSC